MESQDQKTAALNQESPALRRVLRTAFTGGFRAPLRVRNDKLEILPMKSVARPPVAPKFTTQQIQNPDSASVAAVAAKLNAVILYLTKADINGVAKAVADMRDSLTDGGMLER